MKRTISNPFITEKSYEEVSLRKHNEQYEEVSLRKHNEQYEEFPSAPTQTLSTKLFKSPPFTREYSLPSYLEVDRCCAVPIEAVVGRDENDYTKYQESLPKEYYDTTLHIKVPVEDGSLKVFIRNCCKFRVASLGEPLRALFHEKWSSSGPQYSIRLESERALVAFDIALSFSHSVKPKNVPCNLLVATIKVASYYLMFPLFSWIYKELIKKSALEVSLYEALEILEIEIPPEVTCGRELKAIAVRIVIERFEELMREDHYLEEISFNTMSCLLDRSLQSEKALCENDKFTLVFLWIEIDITKRLQHLPHLVKLMEFGAIDSYFSLDVVSSRARLHDCVRDLWMEKIYCFQFKEVSYEFRRIVKVVPPVDLGHPSLGVSEQVEMTDYQYEKGCRFYWNLVWNRKKRYCELIFGVVPELLKNQEDNFLLPLQVEILLPDFNRTESISHVMSRNENMIFRYDNIGNEFNNLSLIFKIKTVKE